MIEFPYQAKDGTVFIHCSTNAEEKAQLETLLSQTKTICRIIGSEGKTGLRIVKELNCNGFLCAIFSLNQIVLLNNEELGLICQEILQKQSH